MTTFNTGNPIGSTDARDRSDNSENLDIAVNSLSQTFVDRLGVTRDTLEGIYQKSAYYRAGTFDSGYTLTNNRQTLAYGNVEYSWSGEFPKTVTAGSTPSSSGGISTGAWVDRTQETLRGELISDALFFGINSVTPEMFGAAGDLISDDKAALLAAIESGRDVYLEHSYGISSSVRPTAAANGIRIYGPGRIASSAGSFIALDLRDTTGVSVEVSVSAGGQRTGLGDGSAIRCGQKTTVKDKTISNYASAGIYIREVDECVVEKARFRSAATVTWDPLLDGNGGGGITTWSIAGDVVIQYAGNRNKILYNDMQSSAGYGVIVQTSNDLDSGKCNDNQIIGNYIDGYNSYGIMLYRATSTPLTSGQEVLRNIVAHNNVRNISGQRRSGVFSDINVDLTFGAGIYNQGAEDSIIESNYTFNTNINTNSETLAPGAIGVANSRRLSILNNKILNANYSGIHWNDAALIGEQTGTSLVHGNSAVNVTRTAYKMYNTRRMKFSCNDAYSCEYGANFNRSASGQELEVLDNNFRSVTQTAIVANLHNYLTIKRNKVLSAGLHGISVGNCQIITLDDNEVFNAAGRGLEVAATNSGIIKGSGNLITGCGTGLYALSPIIWSDDNVVTGNTTNFTGAYTPFGLASSVATPDVKYKSVMSFGPTGALTVTSFLNGYVNQRLTVLFITANTTIQNGSGIYTKTLANKTPAANTTLTFICDGTNWYEI